MADAIQQNLFLQMASFLASFFSCTHQRTSSESIDSDGNILLLNIDILAFNCIDI